MENFRRYRKRHLEEAFKEGKKKEQSFEDWFDGMCCKPNVPTKEDFHSLIEQACNNDIIPEIKTLYNTEEGKKKLTEMFVYFDFEMNTKHI